MTETTLKIEYLSIPNILFNAKSSKLVSIIQKYFFNHNNNTYKNKKTNHAYFSKGVQIEFKV